MKSLLLSLAGLAAMAEGARPDDEVQGLPGWSDGFPSKQYSGYLNITGTKHVHYLLVESEGDPAHDPTVLWLNGGPGCSSLDGYIYEHGPFRVNPANYSELTRFDFTWARQANVLYLEAPVGVGFSFSDDDDEYTVNDDTTAADNLLAIEAFFAEWPELRTNAFFITGESYAGVYVPTLAEAIMNKDKGTGNYSGARLTGIAVGNGCAGTEIGVCGGERDQFTAAYVMGTALINRTLKAAITEACTDWSNPSTECTAAYTEMGRVIGHVNLYNVYGDCVSGSDAEKDGGAFAASSLLSSSSLGLKAPLGPTALQSIVGGPDACIDSRAGSSFFNLEETKRALHVKTPPYKWSTCGNQIHYTSTRTNLPRDTYPALIEYTRVLIYNGDWDLCVPYTDNEAWTEGMGLETVDPWHPWTYSSEDGGSGQVGGYATRYGKGNFTFITIKGGRHEVPETAPAQAFEMLRRMIAGEQF